MKTITLPVLNIYEFQCNNLLIEKFHNDVFSKKISWNKILHPNPSEFGKIITEDYFFHEEFFNWLHDCLKEVSEIHFQGKKLKICDYWMTRSKFGQSSNEHDHRFSLFSGLYYFTDQDNSSTIFTHEYLATSNYRYMVRGKPSATLEVTPQKGKLILFPSFLRHSFIMKDKNVRHTFAFNTFLDGVINDVDSMCLNLHVGNVKNTQGLIDK